MADGHSCLAPRRQPLNVIRHFASSRVTQADRSYLRGNVMTRLEQATHLSQIIGAAAVVLSLVYVGNQISDNTTEVRANAARELTGIGCSVPQFGEAVWEA